MTCSVSQARAYTLLSAMFPRCTGCHWAVGFSQKDPVTTLVPLSRWIERYAPDADWCTWRKLLFVDVKEPVGAHGAQAQAVESALTAIGRRPYPTLLQGLLRRGLPRYLSRGRMEKSSPSSRATGSSRVPKNVPIVLKSQASRSIPRHHRTATDGPVSEVLRRIGVLHPDTDTRTWTPDNFSAKYLPTACLGREFQLPLPSATNKGNVQDDQGKQAPDTASASPDAPVLHTVTVEVVEPSEGHQPDREAEYHVREHLAPIPGVADHQDE